MNKAIAKIVLFLLVFGLFSMGITQAVEAQNEDTRTGSYTTDRGTNVEVSTTLTSEGGTPPLLYTDKEYTLSISITLVELGSDVNDIHDLEFYITISTSSILGSGTPVFSSYYFDADETMIDANQTNTYNFPILITGEVDATTNLDILFKSKEAVDNRFDPDYEFDGVGYEVEIQQNPNSVSFEYDGNSTEVRTQEVFTDEGTNVRIISKIIHEGEEEGRPSFLSSNQYLVTVNITVLELGTDPLDIHDLEVEIVLEDSSITDYIPGNDAVNYFAAYGGDTAALIDGQSRVFNFTMQPNTNINDTDVNLKFKYKFKERIDGFSIDPDSEYSLNIESKLNVGLSNDGFDISDATDTPLNPAYGFLLVFIGIPMLRKYRR